MKVQMKQRKAVGAIAYFDVPTGGIFEYEGHTYRKSFNGLSVCLSNMEPSVIARDSEVMYAGEYRKAKISLQCGSKKRLTIQDMAADIAFSVLGSDHMYIKRKLSDNGVIIIDITEMLISAISMTTEINGQYPYLSATVEVDPS
ncbi:hypothetical protein VPHD508_0122 [Vibrio phage D508]